MPLITSRNVFFLPYTKTNTHLYTMKNYFGFDGDEFVLIGAYDSLGEALRASKGRGFFFVADEDHWKGICKKMENLLEFDYQPA